MTSSVAWAPTRNPEINAIWATPGRMIGYEEHLTGIASRMMSLLDETGEEGQALVREYLGDNAPTPETNGMTLAYTLNSLGYLTLLEEPTLVKGSDLDALAVLLQEEDEPLEALERFLSRAVMML